MKNLAVRGNNSKYICCLSNGFLPFLFSQAPHGPDKHESFLSSLPQLSDRNLRSALHCLMKIWSNTNVSRTWVDHIYLIS